MSDQQNIDIENPAQLLNYLRESNRITADNIPEFVKLDGGVSNRTVWVQGDGIDWILKQALEKLRVEVDWFSAPERIHREASGLRRLSQVIPDSVPEFIFEDMAYHILAMSAIPQPHQNWKTQLLNEIPNNNHAKQFGELLAKIHNAVETSLDIAAEFSDTKFFEELRLEPYYAYTATQVSDAQDYLNQLIVDTRQRKQGLVHGDYSPKNVLLYDDRLYILDYEVIHFGDPAFDIGFSMTHFLSKAHYRKTYRQQFIKIASTYWKTYVDSISSKFVSEFLELYAVRHTLACLLARVAGRSPLEYLSDSQRKHQQKMVLELIEMNIQTMPALISQINHKLEAIHADH